MSGNVRGLIDLAVFGGLLIPLSLAAYSLYKSSSKGLISVGVFFALIIGALLIAIAVSDLIDALIRHPK
jgi:hypothetical protein